MPAKSRAAVLGSPIAHSLSPALHRAAYRALGLDWRYDAIEARGEDLAVFLDGLDDSWAGLSLTMPCKTAIIALLDRVDPLAALVGSVNTVVFGAAGRSGYNTDVAGMAAAIGALRPSSCDRVTLLGGGATARSALAALRGLGTSMVDLFTRRPEAAAELAELAAALGVELQWQPLPGWPARAAGADLTVSTLPAAAWQDVPLALPPTGGATLFDVSYSPDPPPLVAAWREADGRAGGGLPMLVAQAVEQVGLMTGREITPAVVHAMRVAVGLG